MDQKVLTVMMMVNAFVWTISLDKSVTSVHLNDTTTLFVKNVIVILMVLLKTSFNWVDVMQSLKDPYVLVKKTSLVAFVTSASLFFGTSKNSTPRGAKTAIVIAQEPLEPWGFVTKWTVNVLVNPTYLSRRVSGFATSARMVSLALMPITGWDVPNVNVILAVLMSPPEKRPFVTRIAANVLANLAWKDVGVTRS